MWGSQSQPWNQWALQPSMFNNVPHDEIDWAQLAKQWIQMQQGQESAPQPTQAQHMSASGQGGPPFVADEYGGHEPSLPPQMRDSHHPHPEPYPPGANDMGKRPDMPMESGSFPQPDRGGYWQQDWDVRAAAVADIDERVWVGPPVPPTVPVDLPQPLMPNEKKTFDYGHVNEAPTLAMQTVDYNHASDHHPYGYVPPPPPPMPHKKAFMPPPFPMYPAPPPEDPYDQYWSQVAATPMIPATFLKKDKPPSSASSRAAEEETPHIDAAKRKQLPAWIREGLEKMEQERLKRLEKERAEKELLEKSKKSSQSNDVLGLAGYGDSPSRPAKSKFDSDSEKEEEFEEEKEEEDKPVRNSVYEEPIIKKEVNIPLLDCRSDEEKQRDMMLKVRRLLTEVLLDVTTEEMTNIAKEVYQKALAKAPARPLASTTALRSLATVGLSSLASYESHSEASASEGEDSSTSDEELYKRIQEKKKQFALKERKILADLARMEEERKQKEEKRLKEALAMKQDVQGSKAAEPEKTEVFESVLARSGNETNEQENPVIENYKTNNTSNNEIYQPLPESNEEPPSSYPSGLTPPVYTAELPPQLEKPVQLENLENVQRDIEKVSEGNGHHGKRKPGQSESESRSSSSDSESDSHSSYSKSSVSPSGKIRKKSRKKHSDRSRRHSRSRRKSGHRNPSPQRKQGKSKNSSRQGSSESSPGKSELHEREKSRRDRTRGKKKNKDRGARDGSLSSASSGSGEHRRNKSSKRGHHGSHHSPDRRRRRSWSYDRRTKHERRSRSRSRSSKVRSPADLRHGYSDSHHSSRNKSFEEDHHRRSRKDQRRGSRSRSLSRTPPRRYKRKSRSPSFERGRYFKPSKIRSYDR